MVSVVGPTIRKEERRWITYGPQGLQSAFGTKYEAEEWLTILEQQPQFERALARVHGRIDSLFQLRYTPTSLWLMPSIEDRGLYDVLVRFAALLGYEVVHEPWWDNKNAIIFGFIDVLHPAIYISPHLSAIGKCNILIHELLHIHTMYFSGSRGCMEQITQAATECVLLKYGYDTSEYGASYILDHRPRYRDFVHGRLDKETWIAYHWFIDQFESYMRG